MSLHELQQRIEELKLENERLKLQVQSQQNSTLTNQSESTNNHIVNGLSLEEYSRYGRQMIVPQFGSLKSQLKLKNSSVLVIGAGGLGCPALLYIVAAGLGRVGIVDEDTVDISNLHRQVLHTTETVGLPKVESARLHLSKLNPNVKIETYVQSISVENALELTANYDLILDCTDNPATRYLINDAAVLNGKTVVSGSGLKTEGQLSVLNFNQTGPCYRCFYPVPPSANSITSCKDGGVIGPAIGLLGVTMAIETIKILTDVYAESFQPFLSMYGAYPQQNLRVFKMRGKKSTCIACGENPSINKESLKNIDYVAFCGKSGVDLLTSDQRISVADYNKLDKQSSILIDVRPKEQFEITALPSSINIPWESEFAKLDSIDQYLPPDFNKETNTVFVICRYGNDSQLATQRLLEMGFANVKDIKGGLNKWSELIDATIPIY